MIQWLDKEYGFHPKDNSSINIANEFMIYPISFTTTLFAHGNSSICLANFISLNWNYENNAKSTFVMNNPLISVEGFSFYRCILIGY